MDQATVIQSDRVLRILLLEDSALDAELVSEALASAEGSCAARWTWLIASSNLSIHS